MFKPFVRFTGQQNGYGLGLSIAQRAVQLLGGTLTAQSKPGTGLVLLLEFTL
jgi:signal transduction histidine kinase